MFIIGMKKQNLKQVSKEVREEYRRQVKRLHKNGKSYPEISNLLGLSLITVKRYGRSTTTKEKKRGRKSGVQQSLNPSQQKLLKNLITDKTPDQYTLPFALWTRKAVKQLIKSQFSLDLSIVTVGVYLRSWGFSPQKALRRAYERDPKAVEKWLDETYPQIAKDAKKECAEIYWADETGIRNDDQRSRGYAPIGKTPVLTLNNKRFRTNMISAINNRGKVHFMVYQETMTVKLLIKFIVKLYTEADRKVIVILDNLRVHHAKILKSWLEKPKVKKRVEIRYLPAYSPDLNPDEYLNNDLKGEFNRRPPVRSQDDINLQMGECMNLLKSSPKRVENYFKHPSIEYAS
jgi:transposase